MMKLNIEKIGTVGLFITMLTSPCCFPLFGFALTALGMGSFELFGGWSWHVFQALAVLSLVGLFFSYRMHRCLYPLLIALPGVALVILSYHFIDGEYWLNLVYLGVFGMMAASTLDYLKMKAHKQGENLQLHSVITCPSCGHGKEEEMPTDACQFFYECENCKTRLKPKHGDCCVYCSYGTVKCPPIQLNQSCCG